MQHAKDLATPHTQCLLYATYWFRPVLSELLGAATELFDQNRERAPSGPVKVAVSAHERQTAGVCIASRVSTLMAWFPARWASKIAPLFTSGHKAPATGCCRSHDPQHSECATIARDPYTW